MISDNFFASLDDKVDIKTFHNIPEGPLILDRLNSSAERALSSHSKDLSHDLSSERLIEIIKQSIIFVSLDHIYDELHLTSGIMKALYYQTTNQMKTKKSLDIELFYHLAGTTKINDAVKLYSVCTETSLPTSSIAIVRIVHPNTVTNSETLNTVCSEIFQELCNDYQNCEFDYRKTEITLLTEEKKEKLMKLFRFTKEEKEHPNPVSCLLTKISTKDY
jgi:hypothetical protein